MRVTKLSAAAMLLAAAAFCGWYGAAQAENTHAKVRMVQQTNQNAQQEAQKAQQEGQQQGQQQGQHPSTMGQMPGMGGAQSAGATFPQGITSKDLGKAEDVRKTFSSFAQAVLKKDNYSNVIDYFVKADRDRLNSGGNANMDQWNKAVDNFDQAWKSKYNSSFDVPNKDQAYSDKFLTVQQGTVEDPKAVTHWPVTPLQSEAQTFERETANPNLQKGTDIAIASLQGTGNEPWLTASLIQEGSDWKIDIPDTVNADELKASLAKHLDQVVSMKDQWPSDPNDAARLVTYHILQACYTAGTQGGASSQGSTMSGQGGSSAQQESSTQGNRSEENKGQENKTEENKSGSTATPSSSTPGQPGTSGGQGEGTQK